MKLTPEVIKSRKNPLVMLAASLKEKKYRDRHALFSVPGHKLCREAISSGAPIEHVLLCEEYAALHLDEVVSAFRDERYAETPLTVLSEDCFLKISEEKAPEGIILLIKHLDISKKYNKIKDVGFFEKDQPLILLHAIRDPGNLGTILRSAGAFGIGGVLLTEDCADLYHPRTVRAAMGAIFRVPTYTVSDVGAVIADLEAVGRRVLAAELRPGAVSVASASLRSSDTVIIGNEGHGIPPEVSALCTASVYLPILETAESLNAAAAATVFLWELAKTR